MYYDNKSRISTVLILQISILLGDDTVSNNHRLNPKFMPV